MNEFEQTLKMLGFAHRARKLSLGMTSTLSLLKKGKTCAIILASDVSQNADRKFQTLAVQGRVPIFRCGTKSQFGHFYLPVRVVFNFRVLFSIMGVREPGRFNSDYKGSGRRVILICCIPVSLFKSAYWNSSISPNN